jgi:tripartite-type tricarboxylate transporter receptor subunit TctC
MARLLKKAQKEGDRMWRKMLILVLFVLLIASSSVVSAQAKEYPTKPIEVLCSYSGGSLMDLMVRVVAERAPKYLGQPMIVINRPGAGGSLAAAEVVSSAPDGYKITPLTNIFFATTVKMQKVPFNPNDLIPIANIMEYKLGMIVKGDSPWKTFNDLLDYAKKNPGKLRWGHPGRGTSVHLYTLLIFKKAGIEAIDVPYKGGTVENMPALLGGHLDAVATPYGAASEPVKAGLARFVIAYSERRYSDLPNVPSALELGFSEAAKLPTLMGFFAHRNTPEDVQKTLYNALKKTCDDPEFKKEFGKLGEELRFGGPEFVRERIKICEEIGVPLLKELGLYIGK